ncbi:MAG TPA: acetylornithine transaminase [Verrucomicrobiae bacterium]|nr:acetylornithine transaminase [Verrucomicrobiae bacterium]
MREIVPPPPGIERNDQAAIQEQYQRNVVPSYGRFPLAFKHGAGSEIWDVGGRRYLDFATGIAVCCLGHANAEITQALAEQSQKLMHVSNLYYTQPGGQLAEELVKRIGPGKVFFSNSGAEADEGLYKLARKFGHDEGRFEILTAFNSFHGRTLAGISATGQEKVKKGFEPLVQGFRHIPYNDLAAARAAISPATVAILIEGIQGESGVTPATVEYLTGLRKLCDEKKMLLLMDAVQCGHFRTGRYQSFQRILEGHPEGANFLPDGISMAKSLGGGFPMGAFWVRQPYADLLSAGTHGTTFGGNALGCAVALKIISVIERDRLAENIRTLGDRIKGALTALMKKYPQIIKDVRGLGMMMGVEFQANIPTLAGSDKATSLQVISRLHEAGLLTVPSGTQTIRLLPAYNLKQNEADEGVSIIEKLVAKLAS